MGTPMQDMDGSRFTEYANDGPTDEQRGLMEELAYQLLNVIQSDERISGIITRLFCLSTDLGQGIVDSFQSYTRDIKLCLDEGWTPNEIVSMLKWTEGVNDQVDEDFALRRMRDVRKQVETRLSSMVK